MLGHRLLKRVTRLGLSAYLMLWGMSFTVCASDYPISDMLVDGQVIEALQESSSEVTGDEEQVTQDFNDDEVTYAADDDAVTEDDAVTDETQEHADEAGDAETDVEDPFREVTADDAAFSEEETIDADTAEAEVTSDELLKDLPTLATIALNATRIVTAQKMVKLNLSYDLEETEPNPDDFKWTLRDEDHNADTVLLENVSLQTSTGLNNTIYINTDENLEFYVNVTYKDGVENYYVSTECRIEYKPVEIGLSETSISTRAREIELNVTCSPEDAQLLDSDFDWRILNSDKEYDRSFEWSVNVSRYIGVNNTIEIYTYNPVKFYVQVTYKSSTVLLCEVDYLGDQVLDSFALNATEITTVYKNFKLNVTFTPEDAEPLGWRFRWRVYDSNMQYRDDFLRNYANVSLPEGLNNTVYMRTSDPVTFYVVVTYVKDDVTLSQTCKVNYLGEGDPYIQTISLSSHDLVVTDKSKLIELGKPSYMPLNGLIDERYYNVTVLDSNLTDIRDGEYTGGLKATVNSDWSVDISQLTDSAVFYIKYTYENPMADSPAQYPSDICRVQYVAPVYETKIDATFPQKSINVEVYKTENQLPILLLADFEMLSKSAVQVSQKDYITSAEFVDDATRDLFDVEVVDGDMLNVRLRDSILGSKKTAAELNKLFRAKYITALNLTVHRADDTEYELITEEKVTLNIKKSVPKVSAKKITFNPYFAGMQTLGYGLLEPVFTGADVSSFVYATENAGPSWMHEVYGRYLLADNSLTASAKAGKVALNVTISDEQWALPGGNVVKVSLPYAIKNSVPKLKAVGSTKVTLNPRDSYTSTDFVFSIVGGNDKCYECLNFTVYDSKKKEVHDALDVYSYNTTGSDGKPQFGIYASLKSTAKAGTYTISAWPYNGLNMKKGTASSVSIKVLSQKEAGSIGMTVSMKGDINALDPGSYIDLSFKCKNIQYFQSITGTFTDSKGHEVTGFGFGGGGRNAYIYQDSYSDPFVLLKNNLDGQKITVNITAFYLLDGKQQSLSTKKTFTVKRKDVTAKFDVSKASINPEFEDNHTIRYKWSNTEYDYGAMIQVSCGKDNLTVTPYSYETYYRNGEGQIRYWPLGDITNYAGKTVEIKVTPLLPEGVTDRKIKELKTATYKLTVLNSTKVKPSAAAKVKGSINSIDDSSFVNITLSYKNVYYLWAPALDVSIYRMEGNVRKDCKEFFKVKSYAEANMINQTYVELRRESGKTVPEGTYKIDIVTQMRGKTPPPIICNTTASFKVVKGKVSFAADKGTVELFNNNTKRNSFTISAKTKGVNGISDVTIADSRLPFDIIPLGNGRFSIGLKRNEDGSKYVEMSKGKPITSAVTKSVKLNVYNEGSPTPATYTIKVKINP